MRGILALVVPLIFACLASVAALSDPNQIPDYLLECYRNPVQLMPMTMRSFIDLMQKVESDPRLTMNLRMQTNAILKRFWRDGIVRDPSVASMPDVLPFTGAGRSFHKYSLLRRLIPYVEGPSFLEDSLTLNERCTLHFMLSTSMEIWERGDESSICPGGDYQRQASSVYMTGNTKSVCPIEMGVVQTDFGTVSLNHVLLGIATSLQRMDVSQEQLMDGRRRNTRIMFSGDKIINNFWASTIAGDMAELLVMQLPVSNSPKFGPGGKWNDSVLPVFFYQNTNYDGVLRDYWDDTDAEILGGIDGLMVGDQALAWTSITWTLRLSQIMEMFYSRRGGQFPNQQRACNRRDFFVGTLAKNKKVIQEQTSNFAELLADKSTSVLMDNAYITKNTPNVINAFMEYTSNLVAQYPSCPSSSYHSDRRVRLNVIFDATWDPYVTLQVLMKITFIAGVSLFGSTVTAINGANGQVIARGARTSGDLYINWHMSNNSARDVRKSDITEGFLALKDEVESENFLTSRFQPAADVTLVLGKTSFLTDSAIERTTSTLKAIKSKILDMRFMYVVRTEDSRPWVSLTALPHSQNDVVITEDSDNVEDLFPKLEILQHLPRSIVPPLCRQLPSDQMYSFVIEEYVTPGEPRSYMIHPATFCYSTYVDILVENFNYGEIMVCVTSVPIEKAKNPECLSLGKFEKRHFRSDNPCSSKNPYGSHQDWNKDCSPFYIRVTALKSASSCAEKDCRFMDQIRFNFNIGGISCLRDGYSITCSATSFSLSALLLFLVIFNIYLSKLTCPG
ncbi:Hypothetical protein NTJ_14147 [Nesidiocoris tenuis]|uniref:Uncharacterized protein n=1 Tax=Nesidiocoris tenuis TaxID=355587 RepID=A0ABN7BAB7_9HEMI|nr:Hypothetical protein NTJ_14147 [Nesidiocoris tenuis]